MTGTTDESISSDISKRKILLVGDIDKAFLDPDNVKQRGWEVRDDITGGINAAAKNDFAVIGVVICGISGRLSSALKSLNEVRADAKIVLLAEMYEEPIVRQLVDSIVDDMNLADDYLICPIQAKMFYDFVAGRKEGTRDVGLSVAAEDVELERRMKQLEKLATEDDLTGLKNRRYIWEFSRQILKHAEKENGRVTLLVFDIDNFKHYNDIYGHVAGDKILKQAAILMRRCCRAHDVVGRIGGDEFAVVFWDEPIAKSSGAEKERRSAKADHPSEAIFIATRFRKEFEKAELHLLGPKGEGILTISGGLASFPRDGSTIERLFLRADSALLEAKRSGKNRIYLVGEPQSYIADLE
jgi:diguanylate cyclase (GGDEF)-like protein